MDAFFLRYEKSAAAGSPMRILRDISAAAVSDGRLQIFPDPHFFTHFTVKLAFTPLPSFAVAVIFALPAALQVAFPADVIVTTVVLELFQVTALEAPDGFGLMVYVYDLPTVPVRVFPLAVFPLGVMIDIDVIFGRTHFNVKYAVTPLPSFAVAVIFALPAALQVAFPADVTAATVVFELFQVTALDAAAGFGVMVYVYDLPTVPVSVVPLAVFPLGLMIDMEVIFGLAHFNVKVLVTPLPSFAAAVITAVPTALQVAFPADVIGAAEVLELVHDTELDASWGVTVTV